MTDARANGRPSINRRHLLFGFAGLGVGGAVFSLIGGGNTGSLPAALPGPPSRRVATDGWLLPEDERLAYEAADALVESDVLDIRDAVDLPGADLEGRRVSSLGECVAACEEDDRCAGFTYARASHRLPEKRRACWLKTDAAETVVENVPDYVSGRRSGWPES